MRTTLKTLSKSFITDPDHWLGHSAYFDKLFSGLWGDKQEDGSYFIETDSDVFAHTLRHLRTGVLPVFYDNVNGHDFALYQALLGDAEYYAIERLRKWIREKKYLEAVQVRYVTSSTPDGLDKVIGSGMNSTMLPITVRKNVWYCPRAPITLFANAIGNAKQIAWTFMGREVGSNKKFSCGAFCRKKLSSVTIFVSAHISIKTRSRWTQLPKTEKLTMS